jgi:hypothetical protein
MCVCAWVAGPAPDATISPLVTRIALAEDYRLAVASLLALEEDVIGLQLNGPPTIASRCVS